jgi:hypothetical protein
MMPAALASTDAVSLNLFLFFSMSRPRPFASVRRKHASPIHGFREMYVVDCTCYFSSGHAEAGPSSVAFHTRKNPRGRMRTRAMPLMRFLHLQMHAKHWISCARLS